MDADFGLLVDFLRGELDEHAAGELRARLENDEALFGTFERLRRTYAVLRSMPSIGNGAPETHFHADSRFVTDFRREFEARDLAALIPQVVARPEFVNALRVEFCVRAVCASLPMLVVADSFLEALRNEFSSRARIMSLPFIKARPEWIRALRREFGARAVVASFPTLEVRPEFAAALREEFRQRALVGSVPSMEVRAGFERRLKVALVEASADVSAIAAKPVLPTVGASDPFRRRLFKKILVNSRRSVRETPKRVDVDEYQLGREIKRGWKRGRRSVGFTLALHAVAIAITLFIFARVDGPSAMPYIAAGKGETMVTPLEPTPGDMGARLQPENFTVPSVDEEDWSSTNAELAVGLDGHEEPDRERISRDDPDPPAPKVSEYDQDVLSAQIREGGSSFFRLRGMPRSEKVAYLGSAELYEALDDALAWLAKQQSRWSDGRWSYINVGYTTREAELQIVQELEMTSAALLAFLGDGHSSRNSPHGYDKNVRRGIDWILKQQNHTTGQIGPEAKGNVLVHAMATLALAEEFGLTRDNKLRGPLRGACRWLCNVRAADAVQGKAGFPFLIGENASLTTTVWAYMALATARNVNVPPIDLPQERLTSLMGWYSGRLTSGYLVEDQDDVLARTNLLPSAAGAGLSLFAHEEDQDFDNSESILMGRINGAPPNLNADPRVTDRSDIRYLFFGSMAQAMDLQRNGRKSNEWDKAFADTLLANQAADGSWPSTSGYSDLYGQVYSVAFAALSIENAYRVSILSQ